MYTKKIVLPLQSDNSNEAVILNNKDMTTFTIRDREAGNVIESGLSQIEAKQKIQEFEDEDKANNEYVADFYEIAEENA